MGAEFCRGPGNETTAREPVRWKCNRRAIARPPALEFLLGIVSGLGIGPVLVVALGAFKAEEDQEHDAAEKGYKCN